jgi:hypothetical protein
MDLEATAAVEAKAHESSRLNVVARQRQRHQEWFSLDREEQLAAVRKVVRRPEQDPSRVGLVVGIGAAGFVAVRENAMLPLRKSELRIRKRRLAPVHVVQ